MIYGGATMSKKAIAEIDLPRGCYFCPFRETYTSWCRLVRKHVIDAHLYRDSECLLKELPEEEKEAE